MLSQKNRFHGHGSLRYVFRKGNLVRSRCIVVRFSANPHRKNSRFSVVISKKIYKSAVKRNRIRRRVYEIIRNEIEAIQGIQDVVVIVVNPEILHMNHDDLSRQIKSAFSEAGLYTA